MTFPIFSHTGDTATAIIHFCHPWYLRIEPPVGTQGTDHVRVTFLSFYDEFFPLLDARRMEQGVWSMSKPQWQSTPLGLERVDIQGYLVRAESF